jgi:hypothetical protein
MGGRAVVPHGKGGYSPSVGAKAGSGVEMFFSACAWNSVQSFAITSLSSSVSLSRLDLSGVHWLSVSPSGDSCGHSPRGPKTAGLKGRGEGMGREKIRKSGVQ